LEEDLTLLGQEVIVVIFLFITIIIITTIPITNKDLGHLSTRYGLTYPEIYLWSPLVPSLKS
jgi:hypothetical protein